MLHFFRECQEASHATHGRRIYHYVSTAVLLALVAWTVAVHAPVWITPTVLAIDWVLYAFLIRKWIREDALSAYRADQPADFREHGQDAPPPEIQGMKAVTTFESVTGLSAPWVHLVSKSEADLLRDRATEEDVLVVELDGSKMRTLDGLFAEYMRAFSFAEYFGWNWNAFDDRMYDLKWLPARKYLTIVSCSAELLSEERWELATYLRHVELISKRWSTTVGLGYEWGHAEVPFYTILVE